ncbi:MAG: NAD-dependent epimerase/dehydratase family protein [Acidimicrobiia bacterium]
MRVLITGLGTFWGTRLAQELERDPNVEMIVGLDSQDPVLPLERTEFVKADSSYSILSRIVQATQVDTVIHTHLCVDSTELSGRALHEINVIGTMNLLAAAGAAGSTVRKVIVKSSTLVYGSNYKDPAFFREDSPRSRPAHTRVERSLLEVSQFLRNFADDNPHVLLTKLRFSNVLGEDMITPITKMLQLPMMPEIFGFDPRLQFVHQDDVIGAMLYSTLADVPGVYNVAGDGMVTWSEISRMARKPRIPMPPILTNWALEPMRFLRIVDVPPEVEALLRYGRIADNRRFKEAGYRYRYTTVGAVESFLRSLRLTAAVGDARPEYRYEPEVEAFFRHSPAVQRLLKRRASDQEAAAPGAREAIDTTASRARRPANKRS